MENEIAVRRGTDLQSPGNKTQNSAEGVATIKLPELAGDTQVWLGQTIVSIIRLSIENDCVYSKEIQHGFKAELIASMLEELNISVDDIAKVYQSRKENDD